MIASVSLAGMSSRRADASPDTLQNYLQSHIRFARTRRTNLITTHARDTQCLRNTSRKNYAAAFAEERAPRRFKPDLR
jgi:hypothetical protein